MKKTNIQHPAHLMYGADELTIHLLVHYRH